MSASLIGRLGSSTFRLSTNSSVDVAHGSRFSSDSAPRPFHHGIRRRGGTIFWVAPAYVAFAQQPAEIGIVPTLRPARTARSQIQSSREFRRRPSAKLQLPWRRQEVLT